MVAGGVGPEWGGKTGVVEDRGTEAVGLLLIQRHFY